MKNIWHGLKKKFLKLLKCYSNILFYMYRKYNSGRNEVHLIKKRRITCRADKMYK